MGSCPQPTPAMAIAMSASQAAASPAMAMGPDTGQEGRSQPGWAPHQAQQWRPRFPPLQLPEEKQRPILPPLQLREEEVEVEVEVEVELHMCHSRAPIGSQPRRAHHGWRQPLAAEI